MIFIALTADIALTTCHCCRFDDHGTHQVEFQFRCTGCDANSKMTVRVPPEAPFEETADSADNPGAPLLLPRVALTLCCRTKFWQPSSRSTLTACTLTKHRKVHAITTYGFMQVNMDNYGFISFPANETSMMQWKGAFSLLLRAHFQNKFQ